MNDTSDIPLAGALTEIIDQIHERFKVMHNKRSGFMFRFPAFNAGDIHNILKEAAFSVLEKTFVQVEDVVKFPDGISGDTVLRFGRGSSGDKMVLKIAVHKTDRLRRELSFIQGLPEPSRVAYPIIYLTHETVYNGENCLFIFMEDISENYVRVDEILKEDFGKLKEIIVQLCKFYKNSGLYLIGTGFYLAEFLKVKTWERLKRHYIHKLDYFTQTTLKEKDSIRDQIHHLFNADYCALLDSKLLAKGYFIHGDLHLKNVFYDETRKRIKLIDPLADPRVASPIVDFGTFVASAAQLHPFPLQYNKESLFHVVAQLEGFCDLAHLGWYEKYLTEAISSESETKMLWAAILCFAVVPPFRVERWDHFKQMIETIDHWMKFKP